MAELPETGALFEGRYQLEQVLGEGAFARVYRALDVSVNRHVALKVLKPSQDKNFEVVAARFVREMRLVGGLTDPHIVRMFDYGKTDDGCMYMVLELVEGRDLSDVVVDDGPAPEYVAVRVLVQLLYALREAHKAGLLHRDIKPANIRMYTYRDDPYRVKLLDFGIAKPRDEDARLTATGMVVGTPRFMAPEQIYGEDLTASSDLYAVALVIVEMLSTRKVDYLKEVANQRAVTVPADAPVSDGFRAVINRMLEPEPQKRYRDVNGVLQALNVAGLTGTPRGLLPQVHVKPAAPPPRASSSSSMVAIQPPPSTTRNPVLIGLIGAVVVGSLILGAFALGRGTAERPAPTPVDRAPVGTQLTRAAAPTSTITVTPLDAGHQRDASPLTDVVSARPGCGTEPPWRGEVKSMMVRDDDLTEKWWVYIPEGYDKDHHHGVLWAFHDSASSPTHMLRETNWLEVADRGNYVIVAPHHDQMIAPWDGSPANGAIEGAKRALIESAERLCLDLDRVFVLTHGWGGSAAARLSCTHPVAATVTSSWVPKSPKFRCDGLEPKPVPNLFIGPTKTRFLPTKGGPDCVNVKRISFAKYDEMWKTRNQCSGAGKPFFTHDNGTCTVFDCADGAPFVSCRVRGGRGWPGSKPREYDIFKCDGKPADFPLNDVVFDFLELVDKPLRAAK